MSLEFACDTGDKCWIIFKEFVKHEEGEFNLPILNKVSQAAYKLSCLTKVCNRMKSGGGGAYAAAVRHFNEKTAEYREKKPYWKKRIGGWAGGFEPIFKFVEMWLG